MPRAHLLRNGSPGPDSSQPAREPEPALPSHPYPDWRPERGFDARDPAQAQAASCAFGHWFEDGSALAPVDAMLAIEPGALELSAQVGATASAQVRVRNLDRAAHVLDPIASEILEPSHAIAAEQASSLLLAAGETRVVPLRFRPTRAGQFHQVLRFDSDRGSGPAGELEVNGVATDPLPTQERIADRDYEAALAAPEHDPLAIQRRFADQAIDDWAAAAIARDAERAHWLQNNWTHFLGKTGGDVHCASPGLVQQIVRSQLVSAAAKLAAPELEAGGLAAKVVEKVGDKAAEKLADFVLDELGGTREAPSAERAALDASEHTARASIEKSDAIDRARQRADLEIRDAQSAAKLQIAQAPTTSALRDWERWAGAELTQLPRPKDPHDLSLANELLAEWVLERAATPTRANDDTNTTAWNAAREELARDGTLATAARNDLFVHQCRYEWTRLGLDADEIKYAVDDLESKRARLEAEARENGASPENVARWIADSLSDSSFTTFSRSSDWLRTSEALGAHQYQLAPDGPERDCLRGQFDLSCTLWLRHAGSSVYVGHYSYSVAGFSDIVRTP